MNLQRLAYWTFVSIAILVGNLCFAHAPDQGNVFLQIEGDSVKGRVEIALDDLNAALDLNMPSGDDVTIDDVRPWLAEIEAYVSERVALGIGTVSGPPPVTGYGIFDASFARLVQLEFAYENLPEVPSEIEVRYAALFDIQPNHRGMLVIETNWKTGTFQNESQVSGVFKPGEESIKLDLSDSTMFRGFASMVGLGTHHIWIGIDHILFLMALLLPAVVYRERSSWRPVDDFRTAFVHVIKVVTVFTIIVRPTRRVDNRNIDRDRGTAHHRAGLPWRPVVGGICIRVVSRLRFRQCPRRDWHPGRLSRALTARI
jgi:hypothetical protein